MTLEDFKKMTLEARLDYLFNKSQTPKPRNLVYKDEVVIGELESTGRVGEYRVVEFPKQIFGRIDIRDKSLWIDEDGTFTKEAFYSLPTHQPTRGIRYEFST